MPDPTPRAIRSAIDALKRRRQQIAFDANMYKVLHYDIPYTRRCAAEYDRISQSIANLEEALSKKRKRSAPLPAKLDDPPVAERAAATQTRFFDDH